MVHFDWTISLGTVLTILTMVGGFLSFTISLFLRLNTMHQENIRKIDHMMAELDKLQFQIGRLWGWYEHEHGIHQELRDTPE